MDNTIALMMQAIMDFQKVNWRAETTRRGMQHKRSQRQRVGKVPFGFDLAENGVDLVENEIEQEALRLVAELRQSGWSLRQIAAELDQRSLRTKNGNAWSHSSVQSLVNRRHLPR